MIMMGIPLMQCDWRGFGDRDSNLQKVERKPVHVLNTIPSHRVMFLPFFDEELHKLAGNSMHLRAVMVAIGITLRSMQPQKMMKYLEQ